MPALRGITVFFLLVPLLVGCGFSLRGSQASVIDSGAIYVDAVGSITIDESLASALVQSGFTLADNRDEAVRILRLANERIVERVVSVRANGRISELELLHGVDMQLETALGDAAGDEQGEGMGEQSDEPDELDELDDLNASDWREEGDAVGEASALETRVEVAREYTYNENKVLAKENEARVLREEMRRELVDQLVYRIITAVQDDSLFGRSPQ